MYEGPDSVALGDETFILPPEEKKVSEIQKHLPKQNFRDVIRQIKRAAVGRVASIVTATAAAMERLGVERNPDKAVDGTPKGSDQGNVRVLIEWLDKIGPGDAKAIKQLVAIDATATKRVEG